MGSLAKLILLLAPLPAMAATFTLGAVIQAGDTGSTFPELRLGATSAAPSAGGGALWTNGFNHDFRLSYNSAANTATLEADRPTATTYSISWLVTGGVPGSAVMWSIPATGLSVIADNNPARITQIRLRNLSFSGTGFSTISYSNLVANQDGGGTVTDSNTAPITFNTTAGGSWMLSGQVRFSGLGAPGAVGDDLRMAFNIEANAVPEPSTLLLGALGLAGLGVLHHFRARRLRKAKQAPPAPAAQPKA